MDIHIILPKKWTDINPDQLDRLSRIMLKFRNEPEFMIQCFFLFSGWRIVRWKIWVEAEDTWYYFKIKGEKIFRISAYLFYDLVQNLKWIISEFSPLSFVPVIKGFPLPNKLLYNLNVDQFLAAENYYAAFIQTGNYQHLNRMIACLYSDSFTKMNLEKAAKQVGRSVITRRYSVFLWYSGIKAWLRNKYPYVFSGSSDDEDNAPDAVVLNLLSSLNEGDITRNEKILGTRMHQAFHELNNKIEFSKSMKHV